MGNDYIVLFDENNQPYLAHWGNAWKNRSHKYLLKIGQGAKARYFYTQEEIDAYNKRAYGGSVSPKKLLQNIKKAVRVNKRNLNRAVSQLKRSEKRINKVNDRLRDARKSGNSVKIAKAEKAAKETNLKVLNSSTKAMQKKKAYDRSVKQLEALKKESANKKVKSISVSDAFKSGRDKIKSMADSVKNKTLSAITTQEANARQRKVYREGAKEEKKKEETKEKVSDKIKSMADGVKNKTLNAITTQEANAKQRKIYREGAKEEKKKEEYHPSKSKFSEYTKGDKDFDDKNFAEKNRVGGSDFFVAKRSDGSTVILEEDMKWVLPKGVNPNDPAIKRALTKEYKGGSDEWAKQVTEAIDDAIEKINKKK